MLFRFGHSLALQKNSMKYYGSSQLKQTHELIMAKQRWVFHKKNFVWKNVYLSHVTAGKIFFVVSVSTCVRNLSFLPKQVQTFQSFLLSTKILAVLPSQNSKMHTDVWVCSFVCRTACRRVARLLQTMQPGQMWKKNLRNFSRNFTIFRGHDWKQYKI